MAGLMHIDPQHAGRAVGPWPGIVWLAAMTLTGCVPIPYRPSASVSHTPVSAEQAAAISVSPKRNGGMLESLSRSIQHAERRVTLVDGREYLNRLGSQRTLAEVLAGRDPSSTSPVAVNADYLLCVGSPVHRQLHDTGAAAPFVPFPIFWVGYEKIQSRESLIASLVDLHAVTPADALQVSSTYSEVIASFAYGVATVAMPEGALREALARDVAHTIGAAHPAGPIRLIVLAQNGGTAEPERKDPRKPPGALAKADEAARRVDGIRHGAAP